MMFIKSRRPKYADRQKHYTQQETVHMEEVDTNLSFVFKRSMQNKVGGFD
jgi:hypothetical protein